MKAKKTGRQMPTLGEHLTSLYRQRQLTRSEVKSLLDVRDCWRLYLGIEGSLDIVGHLQYHTGVEEALKTLGGVLREAGKRIAACDTNTPYGRTEAMIIRTVVNRWVIDSVAEHLDDEEKSAVFALMQK